MKLRNIITVLSILFLYAFFAKFFSLVFANVFLVCVFIIILVLRLKHKYSIQKPIDTVPNSLLYDKQTLINSYCVVKYFEDEKIVIAENPNIKNTHVLKACIVDKTNCRDVELCWADVCSYFDEDTSFDALFSFIDKASRVLNVVFLNPTEKSITIDRIDEFVTKTIKGRLKEQNCKKTISEENTKTKQKSFQGVYDFKDFKKEELETSDKNEKICINSAGADTLSMLPGINIVKAKKLVEYRNINGKYKSKEVFFEISEAKEHFKEKIFEMITLDESLSKKDIGKRNTERTVDY